MPDAAPVAVAEMPARLEAFLSTETGGRARVASCTPLAGGASREMFAVDVILEGGASPGKHELVLRRDLGGRIYERSLERGEEYRVLVAARAAGVLVPAARWLSEDPAVLGAPFFLQDRVAGETIGRRIVKDPALAAARARLPGQMAAELAKIHRIDTAPLAFLPRPRAGTRAAVADVEDLYRELDRAGDPHPAIELALAWLARSPPRESDETLVHGDFRVGNLMVGPEGLVAVLDWEFARVGDPIEDLAWPLVRSWRFGVDAREVGGVGDRAPYLAAYEAACGRTVRPEDVRFWEIMGNVKWAVGCVAQAHRHLSGQARSVELASLGRKIAEMELDLLDLLEDGG